MAPPVGIPLSKEHAVGKQIGKGAFGQVHAVVLRNSKKETKWAVKLTEIPKKTTKKQTTPPERAHMLLWAEQLNYTGHLQPLCGTVIPRIPLVKDGLQAFYNDTQGYRLLVMERMDKSLFEALGDLVETCSSSRRSSVNLGPIASRLLEVVELTHEKGLILVDVKPDNFMLAPASGKAKKKGAPEEIFASAIRMLDLGLVKHWQGANGHRKNEGVSEVQGTPLYCSLAVHAGNTPSRRDDVEAMIYLLGNLVLKVQGLISGTAPPHGPDDSGFLPWSQEKSDDAIGKAKKSHVTDPKSKYYQAMPRPAAKLLFQALEMVRACKYNKVPDYGGLREQLATLQVPIPAAAAAKKKTPKTKKVAAKEAAATTTNEKSPLRRSSRRRSPAAARARKRPADDDDGDEDEDDSPPPTKKAAATKKFAKDEDSDVEMDDADDDDDKKVAAVDDDDGVMPMDVDSDTDRAEAATTFKKPKKKVRGVQLVIQGRPTVQLLEGGGDYEIQDGKTVASFTMSRKHDGAFVRSIGPHAKTCKLKVDSQTVPPSGTVAFCGQRVVVGPSITVSIQHLPKPGPVAKSKTTAPKASVDTATAASSRSATRAMSEKDANLEKKPAVPVKKKSFTVTVEITTGVLKGETCEMKEKISPTLHIGTAPKGNGDHWILKDAPGVAPRHVTLEFKVVQKTAMVTVTHHKTSSSTVVVNGKLLAPGKSDTAFHGATIKLGDDTTLKIQTS